MQRARALEGKLIDDLAREGYGLGVRAKGKVGELLERLLGATGGPFARHDFPELGVELKTVPVDPPASPRESTYVCKVSIDDAENAIWEESWARKKLQKVLFVPIVFPERRVGRAILWSPDAQEEAILKADFEDAMGTIALGGIEGLSAHAGVALQVRPKARDGKKRALVLGPERELIATVPRGFYLRASFTAKILSR